MGFRRRISLVAVAAVCVLAWAVPAEAQPCFARQLMTPDEWRQHQATMWSLPPAEREAYRTKHHEEMKKRAAAKGLTWPAPPPAMGMGRAMGSAPWGPGWRRYGGWFPPGWGRGPGGPWRRGWGW
jgi:hypothetical protein